MSSFLCGKHTGDGVESDEQVESTGEVSEGGDGVRPASGLLPGRELEDFVEHVLAVPGQGRQIRRSFDPTGRLQQCGVSCHGKAGEITGAPDGLRLQEADGIGPCCLRRLQQVAKRGSSGSSMPRRVKTSRDFIGQQHSRSFRRLRTTPIRAKPHDDVRRIPYHCRGAP